MIYLFILIINYLSNIILIFNYLSNLVYLNSFLILEDKNWCKNDYNFILLLYKIYIILSTYFLNLKSKYVHLKYVINLTNCFKKSRLKFILCNETKSPLNKKKKFIAFRFHFRKSMS